MSNPWEEIDLTAYEAHMQSEGVLQLQTLSQITKEQLACGAASVAILGAAGGNGLEHVDPAAMKEVWALDINEGYLAACRKRFPQLDSVLKTQCRDLAVPGVVLPTSDLVICNLIIEYVGAPAFASLMRANRERVGAVSCVIQRNNGNSFVSASAAAASLQALDCIHRDVNEKELTRAMENAGFHSTYRRLYPLPGGKELARVDYAAGNGRADMKKAVFLDVQGTLGGTGLDDIGSFTFYPVAPEAIRRINDAGLLAIAVTNQSHIAKGLLTMDDFNDQVRALQEELSRFGAKLDDVYCCPHCGADNCGCRKPLPGLIERAAADFNIDIPASYVIGDMGASDMILAATVGAKGVLVLTGVGRGSVAEYRDTWKDYAADYVTTDVLEAVKWILEDRA